MKLNILQNIATSKTMRRFETWALKERPVKNQVGKTVTNYDRLQTIYPNTFMLFAVLSQAAFVYKSEEMPKKRKMPLVLNKLINAGLALAGGLMLNKPTEKFKDKLVARANVLYEGKPNKTILIEGLKTAVPFLVSVVMFKYIGAVLATPLADKANNFLVKKGVIKYDEKKHPKINSVV